MESAEPITGRYNRENRPFNVAVFDHVPNEGEIQADFEPFLLASVTTVCSTHYPGLMHGPIQGQKRVRIAARTGKGDFAGTHQARLFKFTGIWERNDGLRDCHEFILDNPDVDDLGRDTVSNFHYTLDVLYDSDRFKLGWISTLSDDGWYCSAIDLAESNYLWATRIQHLPFDQKIDLSSNPQSDPLPATDPSWLHYY